MNKINIIVPDLPESINDATVVKWHKKIGDIVHSDDNIVDIETDKVTLEIVSPCDGKLKEILEAVGQIVKSQQIIGYISQIDHVQNNILNENIIEKKEKILNETKTNQHFTPSIRRSMKIDQTKNDLQDIKVGIETKKINKNILDKEKNNTSEHRVKMSRLRQTIAERLLYSKKTTAMLTTFNEVNMKPIILLRKKYGEDFEKEHEIRLGFMSFFVKAVVQSLKKFPEINASIDKTDIIYYKNFDISIAISTPKGLITPVLRNAENMSMSEIEKKIKEFSIKGFQNKISITELIGGNFTITNGGIFGSLISTPIINPPQTAILGMHTIQDRPMVVNGKITILPMMYLALSYDHRLIDGKESVGFLVSIKNILEDFTRILIDI
ncbi:dihydrolipoyllysine-residue succinyltransferase [Buchnera aphidicola]|uniref:Dihydrolipoyllysine-residue succinyltransferase n=1 Tax=Buchnera aphidicola str. USDA (Myzus persicae) TaxID=1009856 RepID=W0P3Y8_BUCMP|nr:dihydrolipoyllysine-residue succinyltransferase [Buchnera aphidicola]AHG60080.1 Sucb [Buchnera aphidicola str. USDA (Myzus persicae)]AHG60660.1 Sucb [Buchnera aphidicola str. W106 (Myzus persicae)]AHG61232.1 Sucb [Buchnera aphidicola str. G002 (Myzus persicae)]AHG61805.1 Sucb [Buchnera aphidicola str. F009 (Myzus persicae)]WAI03233.1 MAG: dihydrolipoyllysine-residue succinyltransferase [Buchnera aphidicola (Myzus persicae)]